MRLIRPRLLFPGLGLLCLLAAIAALSSGSADLGAGDISFNIDGTAYNVSVAADASSLNEIRDELNSLTGDDITANVVNVGTESSPQYQLVIAGNDTGVLSDHRPLMPGRGSAAGGGYSTAGDLHRFRNALLDHRLLSPESLDLLIAGRVEIGDQAQYALGFFGYAYYIENTDKLKIVLEDIVGDGKISHTFLKDMRDQIEDLVRREQAVVAQGVECLEPEPLRTLPQTP